MSEDNENDTGAGRDEEAQDVSSDETDGELSECVCV
jgi:hypothetical protein